MLCIAFNWRNEYVAAGHQGKGTTMRCSMLLVSLLVALAAGIPAGEVGRVMIAGMGGGLVPSLLLFVWALCWGV
ncbi:hypothetical protein ACNKHP_07340 [Shigella boydii]